MTPSYTKTSVDLDTTNLDRFKEIFTQHGSVKWFFNACLENFVALHDPEQVDEEIRLSVVAAMKQFHEE